jgi:hypothetical protein
VSHRCTSLAKTGASVHKNRFTGAPVLAPIYWLMIRSTFMGSTLDGSFDPPPVADTADSEDGRKPGHE